LIGKLNMVPDGSPMIKQQDFSDEAYAIATAVSRAGSASSFALGFVPIA
jgi:hypothetical protein